jgi:ATP-dependent Clp protease ATP-binding subunit ClpX
VLTHLNPLDAEALRRILTEPKNSLIKQYKRLFEIDGVKLVIEDEVLDLIVQKAVEFKLGARGLRSICEAVMLDMMYETPSNKNTKTLKIDFEYAQKKLKGSVLNKLKAA